MANRESDQPLKAPEANEKTRRDFLKGSAVVAGGLAAAAAPGIASAAESQQQDTAADAAPKIPMGAPGWRHQPAGLLPAVAGNQNRNFYAPGSELLPKTVRGTL